MHKIHFIDKSRRVCVDDLLRKILTCRIGKEVTLYCLCLCIWDVLRAVR